jgi:hypothetical protein
VVVVVVVMLVEVKDVVVEDTVVVVCTPRERKKGPMRPTRGCYISREKEQSFNVSL